MVEAISLLGYTFIAIVVLAIVTILIGDDFND